MLHEAGASCLLQLMRAQQWMLMLGLETRATARELRAPLPAVRRELLLVSTEGEDARFTGYTIRRMD
jgi:hypothetical protein